MYFLKAVVPYYVLPKTTYPDEYWIEAFGLNGPEDKEMGATVLASVKAKAAAEGVPGLNFMAFHYLYNLRELDFFDNRHDNALRKSPFSLRPTIAWGKWTAFRDVAGLYVAAHDQDLVMFYDRIQAVMTSVSQRGYFTEHLIGKKGFSCSGKAGAEPKDTIRIGHQAMRATIPAWDITPREERVYWAYTNLLACALHNVYEVVLKHTKGKDSWGLLKNGEFWMCLAVYMAGSYGGINKSISTERVLTAEGMDAKIESFLGLPFSLAYPYMNLQFKYGNRDENNKALAEVLKAVLYLNIILGFTSEKVGMRVIPVDYVQASATVNRFTVKGMISRVLTPSRDAGGGGEPFFMPIPTITDTSIGDEFPFYLPWPVTKGMNEYVPGSKRPESFSSMMIDKGEATVPLEGVEDKLSLVTVTRDVRVFKLPHYDDTFVIIKYPVPAADVQNKLEALHWLLAYVSDGTLKPGPLLRTAESICMPKATYPQKSWSPVYQQPQTGVSSSGKTVVSELSHPMPGGIGPTPDLSERVITEKPVFKSVTNKQVPNPTTVLDGGAAKTELPGGLPGPTSDVSEKGTTNN